MSAPETPRNAPRVEHFHENYDGPLTLEGMARG